MAYDYEWFKHEVYRITNIDLNSYKEAQMKRRIDSLIGKYGAEGYDEFVTMMKKDKNILDSFVTYLTINVSEFFRNADQWKLMDEKIIPGLIESFGHNLKIWSAACSTGDEPYTIVMLMSKHIPLSQIHIIATDIDAMAIAKAKEGIYTERDIAGVPEEFRKRYFKKTEDKYQISEEIKSHVNFIKADLLRDTYPNNCSLIICRNVLIYFTDDAKDRIFKKFYDALDEKGIMFIGSTEQILNYRDIGFTRKGSFYYEKGDA